MREAGLIAWRLAAWMCAVRAGGRGGACRGGWWARAQESDVAHCIHGGGGRDETRQRPAFVT